jgi:hypothetical protein
MAYPEPQYQKQETAKDYTKQYELNNSDSILTRQEDGMLGYISAGQFATTSSNEFIGNQFISGNLAVTGDITAHNFVTASTEYYTGSTNHGSNINDTHLFTGSVRITGSLNVIGGINGVINSTNGVISSSAQIKNYGDFAATGSNTFIGNQTITGSFLVSGSTTQIGNNNLYGNTWLYGTVDVSGSTNFHNHTITMTGSMYTSGSQIITGSLDIKGNVNVASGSAFYRWGNKLFNYGAFSDTTIQSASAEQEDTELLMRFNTTDIGGNGVYIQSGSRVYVENTGIYNIQFSAQFDRFSSSGIKVLSIWLKKDGNNVPNSCTDIVVSGGASEGAVVAAWNFVYPIEAGHYVELAWSTPDHNIGISSLTTRTSPIRPAVPSVILTLAQIA